MKRLLLYVVFGVLTTAVNIFLFWLLADVLHVQYLISNLLAIVVSILFAYITNKWYVFKSKTETRKELIREFITFIGARTGTLIFDMVGMFVLVSFLNLDSLVSKIFVNIVVVILNYVFSRLLVFKGAE
ncbi:hypothetical protein AZF37_01900 [endosymbiont 'TC1' of Trimyema compressum]|nr:hypothetical protein AZF37_01900 [endosymbiont 'TC1' of Trimyema compressum]